MKSRLFPRHAQSLFVLSGLTLLTVLGWTSAFAQPDLNNGPKANNPANRAPGANQTPQQRVRRQLQMMGVNQTNVQDALIAYAEKETEANAAIVEKGKKLSISLKAASLTDTQANALLNDYEAFIDDNKARRAAAQDSLVKAKGIDISKMPKVAALLTLMGVYGDGPTVVSGLRKSKAKADKAAVIAGVK